MTYDEIITAQKVLNELLDRGYITEDTREEVAASLGMVEVGTWEGLEEDES